MLALSFEGKKTITSKVGGQSAENQTDLGLGLVRFNVPHDT